jgi:hypothetical protein
VEWIDGGYDVPVSAEMFAKNGVVGFAHFSMLFSNNNNMMKKQRRREKRGGVGNNKWLVALVVEGG